MEELLKESAIIFWVVLKALAIVAVGYFIALILKRKTRKLLHAKDEILAGFISQLVFILSLVVTVVTMLSTIGVQVASILAVLGTAGIAIALALKDSLSSIAGGIVLIVLRPFKKDDIVEIGSIEGKVESVNLFNTAVRLHDNKLAIIPNGSLAGTNIINCTDAPIRRIEVIVGVSYDSNLKLVKQTLQSIVDSMENVDRSKDSMIVLTEFGDSAIVFSVRIWGKIDDGLLSIKSELIEKIKAEFDAKDIEIPYNKLDLYVKTLPSKLA